MFNDFVEKCVVVDETTQYLEILNYSVSGWANCVLQLAWPGWTDWRWIGLFENNRGRAPSGAG